jgi:hypothetical protein
LVFLIHLHLYLILDVDSLSVPLLHQTVEAYGIFSIGEMIGRRNIVGYKLKE